MVELGVSRGSISSRVCSVACEVRRDHVVRSGSPEVEVLWKGRSVDYVRGSRRAHEKVRS